MLINIESPSFTLAQSTCRSLSVLLGIPYIQPSANDIAQLIHSYESLYASSAEDMLFEPLLFLEFANRAEFIRNYRRSLETSNCIVHNFILDPVCRYLKINRYGNLSDDEFRSFLKTCIHLSSHGIKPTHTFVIDFYTSFFLKGYDAVIYQNYKDLQKDIEADNSLSKMITFLKEGAPPDLAEKIKEHLSELNLLSELSLQSV